MEELQITKEIVIALIENGKLTSVETVCKAYQDIHAVVDDIANNPRQR